MRYPSARAELADLPRIERGWAAKSKPSRVAYGREVGDSPRHLDAPLVLGLRLGRLLRDLVLDVEGQRFAQGQFTLGRLVQQAVELVTDR